ncbi:MAG: glycosyltransferase family 2 protein [Brumimicrobium sp.]
MISVIIPTYNRGNVFYDCLNSVINSIEESDEIIVVNDYKESELNINRIERKDKTITVLNNPKQGVASARNYGAEHASGDVLLFIDDDMIINADAIDKCSETLSSTQKTVVNADWIYLPKDLEKIKTTQFGRYLISIGFTSLEGWNENLKWTKNTVIKANGITSQFLMIKKIDFDYLGRYNENFPFAGFEDSEFYLRMNKAGFQPVIDTRCLIYHNEKDRMSLTPFLKRKFRGAVTRKKAVELGFNDFEIKYSAQKRLYYSFLIKIEFVLKGLMNRLPNIKAFDKIYTKLANQQVGLNIFKGYTSK